MKIIQNKIKQHELQFFLHGISFIITTTVRINSYFRNKEQIQSEMTSRFKISPLCDFKFFSVQNI